MLEVLAEEGAEAAQPAGGEVIELDRVEEEEELEEDNYDWERPGSEQ